MANRLQPAALCAAIFVVSGSGVAFAQTDPGVRPGAINGQAGATATSPLPLSSVAANTPTGVQDFFSNGLTRFQNSEAISGTANNGLGPRFNFNNCAGCHSQPTVGGTGGANNPEFTAIANGIAGPNDTTPTFITAHGPTREARFPFFFNSDGTANTNAPNGGVETIFTVSGLTLAKGCTLVQPSFAAAAAAGNLIFRIPTPVFGAGLLENIDDSTLIGVQTAAAGNGLGISGTFNHNGNDGTIARFGWKAQNKSLLLFSGEAYNVEMGISNLLFQQDRPLPGEDGGGGSGLTGLPSTCLNLSGTGYPEDANNPGGTGAAMMDDVSAFANFMRTLAPPLTGSVILNGATVAASSISNGSSLFTSIGCATCHNPTVGTTQKSKITGSLSSAPVAAYSDLELHHMGSGLTDNVSQGSAGGDQFRTAPLWGLGQRIFLLHDGRTTNLKTAIQDHSSRGSEASTV